MGDIKKPQKKYSKPSHPWQKERIDEEKALIREFGLKNKKEIWKMVSLLKKYTSQAKKLSGLHTVQAELEKKQLMMKLASYGVLSETAKLSDILTLTVRDIMERRLQTVLVRKKLVAGMKQSRQFIVHRHIKVGDVKVSVPSYLVRTAEEASIGFVSGSSLSDPGHPERAERAEKAPRPESKPGRRGHRRAVRPMKPRKT